jgi:hypothetical protein
MHAIWAAISFLLLAGSMGRHFFEGVREMVRVKHMSQSHRREILLAEYQCAHMNRDHYDSARWMIGTIFIAASFTLFGITYVENLAGDPTAVVLIGVSSAALMCVWGSYYLHVHRFIILSMIRLHEIEAALQKLAQDAELPSLHKKIGNDTEAPRMGMWITVGLFAMVYLAWLARFLVALLSPSWPNPSIFFLGFAALHVLTWFPIGGLLDEDKWAKDRWDALDKRLSIESKQCRC